ncbi:MAG: T9SS type A sorting domain-containing protein [Bacteroidetes bacterium]|nr:T9SS type A sorting domain-containing protein [Bacteroidota bacterium]
MKTQISTLCFIACLCSHGFTQEKPPVAVDDYAATATGQTIAVNVLANDYGMEGHYLKIFNAIDMQVNFNDSLIIFTPDPEFSGVKKLKYLIKDTVNGLYSGVACLYISVGNPLNEKEIPPENHIITIYPNPAGDYLSISGIPSGYNGNYQILDISGRKVMEGKTSETLNVSGLAPGLYVFRIIFPLPILSHSGQSKQEHKNSFWTYNQIVKL